jgi:flagellar biosynthesis/type III secretory pathway protein FliH
VIPHIYPDAELVHRFAYYDGERGTDLGGRTRIITVELRKADAALGKAVEEMSSAERWALFFRHGSDVGKRVMINAILGEEEGIGMAGKELLTVSEDEKVRAWLMSAEKYDLDRQSELTEARREARKTAHQEGMEKGLERGYKKAKAEDREQIRRLEEEIRRLRGM